MTKTMREVKLELDDIFEDIQSYRGPLPTEDKLFEDVWNWHISQLQSVFEEIENRLQFLLEPKIDEVIEEIRQKYLEVKK